MSAGTTPAKLWFGTASFLLLGCASLWSGVDAWMDGADQIERHVPWLSIRRISFSLPGIGLALILLTPIPVRAALGRPLQRSTQARIWFLVAIAAVLAAAGWWVGANTMQSTAAKAGYTICDDLGRYGLRENGRYWALSPEVCPP